MAKTPHFHCRDTGSIPGWGTKIPHAVQHSKKIIIIIKIRKSVHQRMNGSMNEKISWQGLWIQTETQTCVSTV